MVLKSNFGADSSIFDTAVVIDCMITNDDSIRYSSKKRIQQSLVQDNRSLMFVTQ